MNTVNTHAIKVPRCGLNSSTMKQELRSPVRSRRPDGDGQIVNTALGKSLHNNIPGKCYQYGAVKQGDINTQDSKPLCTHRPSDGTLMYNSTDISASKWGCERQGETDDCLAATAYECAVSVSEPSTSREESSKSQGLNILNALPSSQSAHDRNSRQTIALLKYNISANNVAIPYGRSCQISASDTAVVFHKRQCMAWYPYTRLYICGITKTEDFSIVNIMRTQRKDSYQSDKKCSIPHSDLGGDELIIGSVNKMCSVKCLKTSHLKPAESPFSYNWPVVTGATAGTSSHGHSPGSATTNSVRSPPVSHVGNMFTCQDNNSPLGHSISPSTFSPKARQDRPPSTSSNTILQASIRSSDKNLQYNSFHANSQVQDPTSISRYLPEEPCAEAIPECSVAKDGGYFNEMVDLILRVLFAMYIKESNNRQIKTLTSDTGGHELSNNPGVDRLTSNYKRKSKEKVFSSSLVQRWNPEQCIKDTKPLLPVKYNAPVRSSTRPTSRIKEAEKRARSEPPTKTKKYVSHKPLNYVNKKVFVHLAGDSISPKKAEKHKERPVVSSSSPRKLCSMAHGCTKLSNKIKISPRRQKHFLKAKEEPVNIHKHITEKRKAQNTPVLKDNNATLKKIKYISPKRWADNDIRTVGRGLLHYNDEPTVHNTIYKPKDRFIPNGTKDNRCWTCLSNQAPKSPACAYGLTESTHSRNWRKPHATMLYHDFVDCKHCNNEKLTTGQQVFPKKSYGRENLLVDSLNQIANSGKRYTAMLSSEKTYTGELAGSMSVNEWPDVNIGTGECVGAKNDFDVMKPNKISQHQKPRYDFENNKVAEQMVGRINHPARPGSHVKSTPVLSSLNAKREYHKARKESNICFKDDLKFCLPSWPVESGFHVGRSINNEPQNNYYYSKQCTCGESDEQDEHRKHMKYNGSSLRYDCADSGDSQFSQSVNVIDLSVGNAIPNLPKHRKVFSNGPEYSYAKHIRNTDKAESNIRTAQLSPKCSTEPILIETLPVKENNVKIDTGREHISDIHYCSLPVNPQAINNASNGKYQQLPVHKMNVLSINKCHDEPEPKQLMKWLEADNSSDLILQEMSGMSPSDQKSPLREMSTGKDMLHELDESQDNRRVDRNGLIQRIINDFEFQNYLGEMKCQCSQANGTPKRKNLSRWHVLGHADKDVKMIHRAMTSSRTLNDDTGWREVSPNNAQRDIYDHTSHQTLINDYNIKMKSPCGHKLPGYLSEIEETLFQGGEPTLAEKHFRYPPAGDAVLGNVTQSADCYLKSTLQQIHAKNINKNKSGISSSEKPLNKTSLHKVQLRANYPHLESNAYLSWGFDQANILRNSSRFSCVHSDFDQSENVEMDNLIMSKDQNVSKQNFDSKYPLEVCPTLLRSVKNTCILEARGTPHKGHHDDRMIACVFNRDTQSDVVEQTIPGDNPNYSGHPYAFMERGPWAHRWNRWQVFNVQEEPLDLSIKKRKTSPLISHLEGSCDNCLLDLVPIEPDHTWFPLQSSPLDLSTKRPC